MTWKEKHKWIFKNLIHSNSEGTLPPNKFIFSEVLVIHDFFSQQESQIRKWCLFAELMKRSFSHPLYRSHEGTTYFHVRISAFRKLTLWFRTFIIVKEHKTNDLLLHQHSLLNIHILVQIHSFVWYTVDPRTTWRLRAPALLEAENPSIICSGPSIPFGSSISTVLQPKRSTDQPTADGAIPSSLSWKKPACKWTHPVQLHAAQGSAGLSYDAFNIL